MLYKLFSAVSRCAPCKALVNNLNIQFPEWKEYIEYVDVDSKLSEENLNLIIKLDIKKIPTFTDNNKILSFLNPLSAKKIKEVCLTKE